MNSYEERLRVRFWEKVRKIKKGCWEWVAVTAHGYGRISVRGVMVLAHRLSWIWANGEIPKGMFVLHKCDNPTCVNPNHLFLGTKKDNTQDCIRKGRFVYNAGGPGAPPVRIRTSDGYVQCGGCRVFLPRGDFYKNPNSKSHGCASYCKKCSVVYQRSYRAKRKDASCRR